MKGSFGDIQGRMHRCFEVLNVSKDFQDHRKNEAS